MDDDSEEVLTIPAKLVRNIAPKARSLRIHGIFAKPATKVGIVATKAAFLIKQFLNTEIPMLPPVQSFIGRIEKMQPEEKDTPEEDSSSGDKAKSKATQKRKDIDELVKLVKHSREMLAKSTTVFPFTFFPDTITVDRTKVTIHKRSFFFVSETVSIRIADIMNVTCGVGPIFGSITITIVMTGDRLTTNFFWRNDAVYLKHIIQGLVIATSNNADTTKLSKHELITTLAELGHDANT